MSKVLGYTSGLLDSQDGDKEFEFPGRRGRRCPAEVCLVHVRLVPGFLIFLVLVQSGLGAEPLGPRPAGFGPWTTDRYNLRSKKTSKLTGFYRPNIDNCNSCTDKISMSDSLKILIV